MESQWIQFFLVTNLYNFIIFVFTSIYFVLQLIKKIFVIKENLKLSEKEEKINFMFHQSITLQMKLFLFKNVINEDNFYVKLLFTSKSYYKIKYINKNIEKERGSR